MAANTDYLVTLTRDGSTGLTKVYLDNVLPATYTGTIAVPTNNLLKFFEDDGKNGEATSGSVDYIATFDGVLTDSDVTTLAGSMLGTTVSQTTVTVPEGSTATNTGTWSGNGLEPVTLTASSGTVVQNNDGSWSWSMPTTDGPDDSRTVTITGTDGNGASTSVNFALVVNNVPPTVTFTASSVTVNEGDVATMTGTFFRYLASVLEALRHRDRRD